MMISLRTFGILSLLKTKLPRIEISGRLNGSNSLIIVNDSQLVSNESREIVLDITKNQYENYMDRYGEVSIPLEEIDKNYNYKNGNKN
mmetsp:Transcript_885/g.766  ORF Transcript_885/g.766 Transcript_885/m.766 type:complete len:88 (-) Transcript_885:57-320(-)